MSSQLNNAHPLQLSSPWQCHWLLISSLNCISSTGRLLLTLSLYVENDEEPIIEHESAVYLILAAHAVRHRGPLKDTFTTADGRNFDHFIGASVKPKILFCS
jgi:hypothetical protein